MTALAQESQPTQEELFLESFLALEAPEGSSAEFIDGEIVVTPPPDGEHEDCLSTVGFQVHSAPRELRLFRGAPTWMPSEGDHRDHRDHGVTRFAPFGKPPPEPFEFELDTGELL